MNVNELPIDGAVRELYEETGIKADKSDLKFLGTGDTGRVLVHSYKYDVNNVEVDLTKDPDKEADDHGWFDADSDSDYSDGIPDNVHTPNDKNITLVLMNRVTGSDTLKLNPAELAKMAIKDLSPGESFEDEHGQEAHDYGHLLPKKWNRLSLHVHTNSGNDVVLASLKDEDGKEVGNVKGLVELNKQKEKTIQPHSDLHEDYHGEGLGKAMYEALYAHSLHHLGINKVAGGNHSEDAGKVHESLARKHGLEYVPQAKGSIYGLTRKPYNYLIKNEAQEQAYSDKVQKKLRDLNAVMFPNSTSDQDVYKLWDLFGDEDSLKEMYKQHPEHKKDIAIIAANSARARDTELYHSGDKEDILEYMKHGSNDKGLKKEMLRGGRQDIAKDLIDAYPRGRAKAISLHLRAGPGNVHPDIIKEVISNQLKGDNTHSIHPKTLNNYMDRKETSPEEALDVVKASSSVARPDLAQHPKIPVEVAHKWARQNPTSITKLHPDYNSNQISEIVDNAEGGIGTMKEEAQRSVAYHSNTPKHVLRQLTHASQPEPEPFDPEEVSQSYFNNEFSYYHKPKENLQEAITKAKETALDDPKQAAKDLYQHIRTFPFNAQLGLRGDEDFDYIHDIAGDTLQTLESRYDKEWQNYVDLEKDRFEEEQQNQWHEPDVDAISAAASHPNIDRETAYELAQGEGHPSAVEGAVYNTNLNKEDLQGLIKKGGHISRGEAASHALAMEDPDSYHANSEFQKLDVPDVSTEKVRQLRDKVDALGGVVHHKKVLDNVPASIKPFLDSKGQLHSSKLQEAIDNVPKTSYWVGHHGEWDGAQRHSLAPSDVFHVNYTGEHVKKMKEAGVFDTFKRIQSFITRPDIANHPVGPTTIGWVRHTGENPHDADLVGHEGNPSVPGIHVDEVQSDLGGARLTDEFRSLGVHIPEEHLSKIKNILWGNRKTAQDLVAEGFLHHQRQKPENINKPVHWPSYDLKAVHGSPQDTYKRLPKDLGFAEKAGVYGDLQTQSDPSTQGKPTHTSKITKFEDDAFFNQPGHEHKALLSAINDKIPDIHHHYLAVEVLSHLLNDKSWIPHSVNHEGKTHWFMKNRNGEILDPTSDSFKSKVPYEEGRPTKLMSARPSNKALEVISHVQARMAAQNDPTLKKGVAGALAGIVMAASPGLKAAFDKVNPPKQEQFEQAVSKAPKWTPSGLHPDLIPLAHLESSFGQNMEHAKHSKGEYHTAFGPVGMKPSTAHEEWHKSDKLKHLYPGLEDPKHFMDKFKNDWQFHNLLASSHFLRLKHRHGTPEKAAYAWRYGSGAAAGVPEETISKEPYVLRYRDLAASSGIRKSEDPPIPVKHYSTVPGIKQLDPKLQGSGMVGAEKGRPKRIPRTYLYHRSAEPEGVVTAGAAHLYHGNLPGNTKLYDLGEDTLGINRPKWRNTKYGQEYHVPDLDLVEKKIAKLGYHGYHNYGVPGAIAYFHPVKVQHVETGGRSVYKK